MNRLWRLLHHLFGDEPPPRPVGPGHHHHQRRHRHRHDERDEEARRQADEQVADAADDGPAPPAHHAH